MTDRGGKVAEKTEVTVGSRMTASLAAGLDDLCVRLSPPLTRSGFISALVAEERRRYEAGEEGLFVYERRPEAAE